MRIRRDMTEMFHAQVARGVQFEEGDHDPLGTQLRKLEEQIGLRHNPADDALALHQAWLAQQGRAWDDTPVSADDQWLAGDVDIEFTSMDDLVHQTTRKG